MIIGEAKFATATITLDGHAHKFDELRVAVHLTAHGAQPYLDSRRQPQ